MTMEQKAREEIDQLLAAAGSSVKLRDRADLTAAQDLPYANTLKPGHGFADYLQYVNGAAVGVIEAKKTGIPLTAVGLRARSGQPFIPGTRITVQDVRGLAWRQNHRIHHYRRLSLTNNLRRHPRRRYLAEYKPLISAEPAN